jgi:hypothetical protein
MCSSRCYRRCVAGLIIPVIAIGISVLALWLVYSIVRALGLDALEIAISWRKAHRSELTGRLFAIAPPSGRVEGRSPQLRSMEGKNYEARLRFAAMLRMSVRPITRAVGWVPIEGEPEQCLESELVQVSRLIWHPPRMGEQAVVAHMERIERQKGGE